MAVKLFWVYLNSYHREKEKETDIKSYLVEWYIKQPWVKTLDNTYNSYKHADSVNFFLNWRTDSYRLWKGIFPLNYRVIFSTPIELYNQRWSNIVLGSIIENEFNKTMTSWTHGYRKGSEMKMDFSWGKNPFLYCIHGAFKLL